MEEVPLACKRATDRHKREIWRSLLPARGRQTGTREKYGGGPSCLQEGDRQAQERNMEEVPLACKRVTVRHKREIWRRSLLPARGRQTGTRFGGQYLLLLLLVSVDTEPTAHDIQETLPRYGLEPSGAGARNTLSTAFVSVVRGLHRAGGVEAGARSTQPLADHAPRSSNDSCNIK
jgi:hypothetical protein